MFSDQESASKATKRPTHNPQSGAQSCSVVIRKDDFLAVYNMLRTKRKTEEEKLMNEPEKYKCENCARNYKRRKILNAHKKYECGVTPQFTCELCGKRFTRKYNLRYHIDKLHCETKLSISKRIYNCDKCTRSYRSVSGLNQHKRLHHAEVKPQFICDYCGHETKLKNNLEKHINTHHLK